MKGAKFHMTDEGLIKTSLRIENFSLCFRSKINSVISYIKHVNLMSTVNYIYNRKHFVFVLKSLLKLLKYSSVNLRRYVLFEHFVLNQYLIN